MRGVKKMFKFYFCLEFKHSQKELIGIVACSNKSCLPYKGEFHMKNELNMDTNFSERKNKRPPLLPKSHFSFIFEEYA